MAWYADDYILVYLKDASSVGQPFSDRMFVTGTNCRLSRYCLGAAVEDREKVWIPGFRIDFRKREIPKRNKAFQPL